MLMLHVQPLVCAVQVSSTISQIGIDASTSWFVAVSVQAKISCSMADFKSVSVLNQEWYVEVSS